MKATNIGIFSAAAFSNIMSMKMTIHIIEFLGRAHATVISRLRQVVVCLCTLALWQLMGHKDRSGC